MQQILEKDLPHSTQDAGLYQTYCLRTKVSDEELLAMLLRENVSFRIGLDTEKRRLEAEAWEIWAQQMQQLAREYQHTGTWPDALEAQVIADRQTRLDQVDESALFDCWEGVFRGELGRGLIVPGPHCWNKITTAYLKDTEGARLCNAFTSNEDGIVRYLAVGTNAVPAASSDTALGREIFRNTPLTRKNTTSGSKIVLKLGFDEANLTTATTIAAGDWSVLAFGVADTTGFNVGDAILIGTSPAQSTSRIATITPGTPGSFTLETTEPLLSIPTVGQAVTLQLGEFSAFGNGLATITPGSGTLFSRTASPTARLPKNDELCWFIKYQYIRTAI